MYTINGILRQRKHRSYHDIKSLESHMAPHLTRNEPILMHVYNHDIITMSCTVQRATYVSLSKRRERESIQHSATGICTCQGLCRCTLWSQMPRQLVCCSHGSTQKMAVKAAKAAVAGALWHRIQRIWLQQCIAIMRDTNTNASDPHITDFGSASKPLLLMYNSTQAAS